MKPQISHDEQNKKFDLFHLQMNKIKKLFYVGRQEKILQIEQIQDGLRTHTKRDLLVKLVIYFVEPKKKLPKF